MDQAEKKQLEKIQKWSVELQKATSPKRKKDVTKHLKKLVYELEDYRKLKKESNEKKGNTRCSN